MSRKKVERNISYDDVRKKYYVSYADIADLSESAIAAMQWACGAGIIQGDNGGSRLNPLADCTCAQAASVLMRFSDSAAE